MGWGPKARGLAHGAQARIRRLDGRREGSNASDNAFFPEETGYGGQILNEEKTEVLPTRILRLPEVIFRVGLKRASFYRSISSGVFPPPISLGASGRGVGRAANRCMDCGAEVMRNHN